LRQLGKPAQWVISYPFVHVTGLWKEKSINGSSILHLHNIEMRFCEQVYQQTIEMSPKVIGEGPWNDSEQQLKER